MHKLSTNLCHCGHFGYDTIRSGNKVTNTLNECVAINFSDEMNQAGKVAQLNAEQYGTEILWNVGNFLYYNAIINLRSQPLKPQMSYRSDFTAPKHFEGGNPTEWKQTTPQTGAGSWSKQPGQSWTLSILVCLQQICLPKPLLN